MENYFFINPKAGQGKGIDKLAANIEAAAAALGMTAKIYITKGVGDGERKARETAQSLDGRPARFYACGGDGTNNEIINGTIGFDQIAVGCIPIGTGNDTVRNFPGDFLDIKAQLLGTTQKIDLIRYSGVLNGIYQERFCVNMFNIGFDCNVVELTSRLKKKPLIAGSMAYLLAVMGMFVQKKGIELKLVEDDKTLIDGEVLLCAISNGSYCGGGMYTSPQALISDGIFDLNIIKDVPRLTFLRLFPKYKKGTHLQVPGIEDILTIKKCRSLNLEPKRDHFFLCADGEISTAEAIHFEIVPRVLDFIVPTGYKMHKSIISNLYTVDNYI